MANEKIKGKKKYASNLDFYWGDALNLKGYDRQGFDRVMALESAQQFEDKSIFFKGAHRVLKKNGYLCMAEPIPNHASAYDLESFPDIESELLENHLIDRYGELLKEKLNFILNREKGLMKEYKNYNVYYDRYIRMLEKNGFEIDEIQDISFKVAGYYPVVQKRILEGLRSLSPQNPKSQFLLMMLAVFYSRYRSFLGRSAGFYLIRAKVV
jgi:ubiquinone/menaquinone biosynthesis C-methylase UbiE